MAGRGLRASPCSGGGSLAFPNLMWALTCFFLVWLGFKVWALLRWYYILRVHGFDLINYGLRGASGFWVDAVCLATWPFCVRGYQARTKESLLSSHSDTLFGSTTARPLNPCLGILLGLLGLDQHVEAWDSHCYVHLAAPVPQQDDGRSISWIARPYLWWTYGST